MAVDKLNPQSMALFFGQHQRQINRFVVAILAIYLLAFLADLVWRIIPEPKTSAQNAGQIAENNAQSSSNNSPNTDIRALQQLNLFGDLVVQTQPVQEAVTDAPETRLNLVLTGVVSSSNLDYGTAVIEHRGSQAVYGIGEKIEGTNAILHQVQSDRVIIRNGVRNETLMMEGIDYEQANRAREARLREVAVAQRNSSRNVTAPAPASRLSNEAIEATRQLRESPDSFVDFISVAPHREDDVTVGYKISPGKNPALFEATGLKSGDVVTLINGLDLTDPQQSIDAMGELRNAEFIELTVNRNGEILTLYLELPEA
ncbi:type II secretion system protein GspC [Alteromonas sediminis]|uniref:Type II secretion system protein GspC n=1 Tax=Alteromonas sediminis TaxID=2259342 RepID=A0A3N5XZH3_9ALTE|nr:type II secretion system protein GspC [Alteromonas sediminis]RPJ66697.1 type II secretion system protein GspC [Alteromonas sediminis]